VSVVSQHLPLILDLSLIQTLDYYTGIVFEVSDIQTRILGQGGRYDQLLDFIIHKEKQFQELVLHSYRRLSKFCCLPISCLSIPQPATGWLYQRTLLLMPPPLPMQKTQKFHASSTGRNGSEGHEPDAIREYARRRRIHQIAWSRKVTGD